MGKKNYGSCYGEPYQRFRYLIKYIENYYGRKTKILIPNALDGQHILPSVRKGYKVDCYETISEFINGGIIGKYNIVGLKTKFDYFKMWDSVKLFESNFYEQRVENEYEFVYCYKSLHLEQNKNIPKDRKMRKLLSSVKENGFIYIFYHLAENENDYINYPKNQYFRKFEIQNYFDDSWEIVFAMESNLLTKDTAHPFNEKEHSHLVGHIFARKLYKRRKYKYTYNIKVGCYNYNKIEDLTT